jgi:HSP20 family protein
MMMPMSARWGVQRDPFWELDQLHREMDRLFNGYTRARSTYPALSAWANDEEVVVMAEIPGVDPADVNVTVDDTVLTIEGERKAEDVGDDATVHRSERGAGGFSRAVRLPFAVEEDQVKAHCSRGVLEIRLPRRETSKPMKIKVG